MLCSESRCLVGFLQETYYAANSSDVTFSIPVNSVLICEDTYTTGDSALPVRSVFRATDPQGWGCSIFSAHMASETASLYTIGLNPERKLALTTREGGGRELKFAAAAVAAGAGAGAGGGAGAGVGVDVRYLTCRELLSDPELSSCTCVEHRGDFVVLTAAAR